MRVKLRSFYNGAGGPFAPGDVVDLPDGVGQMLCDGGGAFAVDTPATATSPVDVSGEPEDDEADDASDSDDPPKRKRGRPRKTEQ